MEIIEKSYLSSLFFLFLANNLLSSHPAVREGKMRERILFFSPSLELMPPLNSSSKSRPLRLVAFAFPELEDKNPIPAHALLERRRLAAGGVRSAGKIKSALLFLSRVE